jgi:starch phosphorylase
MLPSIFGIIFAGKAHPKDDIGFTYVNEMLSAIDSLDHERETLRVLMLENYDTYFGKLLSSSVDVWLNNPLPPFEASGTSGMKAILNGVLQLSTLDGWVVEVADKKIEETGFGGSFLKGFFNKL